MGLIVGYRENPVVKISLSIANMVYIIVRMFMLLCINDSKNDAKLMCYQIDNKISTVYLRVSHTHKD